MLETKMLLIISRNDDRPELESKILAAAFRQSVERGDIDGSRLAHRELVGLLARKAQHARATDKNVDLLEHIYASDTVPFDLQALSAEKRGYVPPARVSQASEPPVADNSDLAGQNGADDDGFSTYQASATESESSSGWVDMSPSPDEATDMSAPMSMVVPPASVIVPPVPSIAAAGRESTNVDRKSREADGSFYDDVLDGTDFTIPEDAAGTANSSFLSNSADLEFGAGDTNEDAAPIADISEKQGDIAFAAEPVAEAAVTELSVKAVNHELETPAASDSFEVPLHSAMHPPAQSKKVSNENNGDLPFENFAPDTTAAKLMNESSEPVSSVSAAASIEAKSKAATNDKHYLSSEFEEILHEKTTAEASSAANSTTVSSKLAETEVAKNAQQKPAIDEDDDDDDVPSIDPAAILSAAWNDVGVKPSAGSSKGTKGAKGAQTAAVTEQSVAPPVNIPAQPAAAAAVHPAAELAMVAAAESAMASAAELARAAAAEAAMAATVESAMAAAAKSARAGAGKSTMTSAVESAMASAAEAAMAAAAESAMVSAAEPATTSAVEPATTAAAEPAAASTAQPAATSAAQSAREQVGYSNEAPHSVPSDQEINTLASSPHVHQDPEFHADSYDPAASQEVYANIDFGGSDEKHEQTQQYTPPSIAALLAHRVPPDPDATTYYPWIGSEPTDPFFVMHVCYLRAVRRLLKKQFYAEKGQGLNPHEFKRQLKNMSVSFSILYDPRTRLDYDLRQLGLREPDYGNGLQVPKEARLPDVGGKVKISFSELLILCRIFDFDQMLAIVNAARLLSEERFWNYLAESGLLTVVELDSIKTGFQFICNGLMTVCQFEQAFQYARQQQQQLLEVVLAAGWVRMEDLQAYANSPDREVLPEAPKFVEASVKRQPTAQVTQPIQVAATMPSWMEWGGEGESTENAEPAVVASTAAPTGAPSFAAALASVAAQAPPGAIAAPTDEEQMPDVQTGDMHAGDMHAADLQTVDMQTVDMQTANLQMVDVQTVDAETEDLQTIDTQDENVENLELESVSFEEKWSDAFREALAQVSEETAQAGENAPQPSVISEQPSIDLTPQSDLTEQGSRDAQQSNMLAQGSGDIQQSGDAQQSDMTATASEDAQKSDLIATASGDAQKSASTAAAEDAQKSAQTANVSGDSAQTEENITAASTPPVGTAHGDVTPQNSSKVLNGSNNGENNKADNESSSKADNGASGGDSKGSNTKPKRTKHTNPFANYRADDAVPASLGAAISAAQAQNDEEKKLAPNTNTVPSSLGIAITAAHENSSSDKTLKNFEAAIADLEARMEEEESK